MSRLKAINVLSGQKCMKYFVKKYIAETMASTPVYYVADLEICLNSMKFDPPFFSQHRTPIFSMKQFPYMDSFASL